MPTYQYQCTECGQALEVQQSFSDDALTVCPACDGRLRKVFNAVGVVFKGSGFYRTDSRSDSSPKGGSSGSSSSTSQESSSSASSTTSATTSAKDSGGSTSSGGSKDSGSAA